MARGLVVFLLLGLAGVAYAVDTGNRLDLHKVPLPFNPDQGDGREGGETIADAAVIPECPFNDSGNTCDNLNNYDEACPHAGSTAPDIVYSFTWDNFGLVIVDLCYSSYDTKVFVYANAQGNLVACNDDFYFGPPCYTYSSKVSFTATPVDTYYIVIDGYSGACGAYQMDVTCEVELPIICCPPWGVWEGEPPLVDYYIDQWNGGCNSTPHVFQDIHWIDTTTGCGILCGVSGWYYNYGSFRDTDWFPVTAAGFEMSTQLCAQLGCNMYVLNTDCSDIVVLYSASTAGYPPCGTITWATNPGDQFWLWVGPDTYSGPVDQFYYVMTVCGHVYDLVPVEVSSWGAVKKMYR